jgi:catechol 2,3-dioxygenase-like lactoylglutathione lyase family enzyme
MPNNPYVVGDTVAIPPAYSQCDHFWYVAALTGKGAPPMAIGRWKSVCINVTDLETAYTFWSEVLGWEIVRDAEWHGWLGYLDDPDSDNYMILNNTTTAPVALTPPSHHEANRAHIDIYPNNGMDQAITDIIALGGTVKKPPSLYPRPGTYGDEPPAIDWAVMQDPFGNEFCIVERLTPEQKTAAMASDATTDHELRIAAGVTNPQKAEPHRPGHTRFLEHHRT